MALSAGSEDEAARLLALARAELARIERAPIGARKRHEALTWFYVCEAWRVLHQDGEIDGTRH